MKAPLPDPTARHPIILPDGTPHAGTVHLSQCPRPVQFEVGDYTYASDFDPPDTPEGWATRLAPYLFAFSKETLRIGRFCQIAHGVRFITASANHATTGISTFPFQVFDTARDSTIAPDTRDTVIGHDVWLGYGAIVLPGAQIGNGVIVGAGAVVRGTVPDYAIVTGNPAAIVKMRFSAAQIDMLNDVAWWHWPTEKIARHITLIEQGDVAALARAVNPN
ncbi:CatB-related O-acetyltransferase [Oceaniglobus ichthyenteri]|uniref:CatB-related O-acetyltransferase n=1 Tax=Oceaniglobus ichthyenteri TaxID=2136177 RepID=UPI000D38E313|nr:CatB-related O-acetyltransferase [Oceaniglobus ichthyenteri]